MLQDVAVLNRSTLHPGDCNELATAGYAAHPNQGVAFLPNVPVKASNVLADNDIFLFSIILLPFATKCSSGGINMQFLGLLLALEDSF